MKLSPAQIRALLNLLEDATRPGGTRRHRPARIDTLASLRRKGLVSFDTSAYDKLTGWNCALAGITDLGIEVAWGLVSPAALKSYKSNI